MTIEIPLTRGCVAIVDDEDADLAELKWFATAQLYVGRKVEKKRILLHRIVLARMLKRELLPSEFCDHVNGNGLDNRRSNLRLATRIENSRNRRINKNSTSNLKGVSWDKHASKWRAQIKVNGKRKNLGRFNTAEVAHEAYCTAAKEHFGEFFNPGTKPETAE